MGELQTDVCKSDIQKMSIWERVLLRARPRSRKVSFLLEWLEFRLKLDVHTEDGEGK